MAKIQIDKDEIYPIYLLATDRQGDVEIEMTEADFERYKKIADDFWATQEELEKLLDTAKKIAEDFLAAQIIKNQKSRI